MATQAKSRVKSTHGNTLYNGTKQGIKADRPALDGEKICSHHIIATPQKDLNLVV